MNRIPISSARQRWSGDMVTPEQRLHGSGLSSEGTLAERIRSPSTWYKLSIIGQLDAVAGLHDDE
ncbi:MAG: hypothetical protein HQL78_13580, partial [Magnetococcales bacterium]|nr:hypothetical protein [Magnetococcales bacterium]